jgi:hypothetical protein
MKKWFRFSQKEIDQLKDEEFFQKAAEAYYLQKSEIENGKLAFLQAVGELFK